jgi:cytosine/adenosine deaminase-related metal-dependent hydrolase
MKAYLADWILPVATPPIHNGALVVDEEGCIVFVGEREKMPSGTEQTAYPSSVIMPGLINAHTHLEFSDLEAPLGQPGIEFTQWIGEVIKFRFGGGRVAKPKALQMGLKQSAKHGVAAVGEIATSPLAVEDYLGALPCPMFLRVFFEQLGSDDSVIDQKITELEELLPPSVRTRLIRLAIDCSKSWLPSPSRSDPASRCTWQKRWPSASLLK